MFAALLLITACGSNDEVELVSTYKMIKVHENIGEEVLDDANDVIEKIENELSEGNNLTEDSFSSFLDKYETELDHVNNEEFEFIMALSLLMMSVDGYNSGEYDLSDDIDRFYKTAKTGEYQPLNRKDEYYDEFYKDVASTFYENEQGQEQEEKEPKNEERSEGVSENNGDVELEDDNEEEPEETQYDINDIKWAVEDIVDEDLDNTTITDLRINEDASIDEERYIVLVDVEWDVKNKPKTTKDMLDMYSDHLAASLADNELVYELVLFWTVPYHNEDESILKRTYQNKNDGMYLEDEMKDITVFD